ncbi:hypothetical protein IFM89_023238 [Coptis chinensis]|uniref:Uncharacterized protein n=1 Tax=Coptis chinensis TaxID=261450 RepID=A0A835M3W0_9MAGN|nr:hypothetical protein IFM89_023238 [Coptis chinensis]
MDHKVIGVFCYNGGSISIRIGLDSSINGVVQELHVKWLDLGLKCYNMCFNRDEKDNMIESDGELHSLACYCFAKKIAIVEIKVVVCVTSLITLMVLFLQVFQLVVVVWWLFVNLSSLIFG